MKKISAILSFAVLLLCGCTVSELNGERCESHVFTASFEEMPGTKTYVDENLKLLWNADDRLSIFTSTLNEQYSFDGNAGDNSGTFTKISSSQFETGNSISTNYAVYPYSSSTKLTNDEKIILTMPSVQSYAESSFGLGANTMIAVTAAPSDYFLPFKNLCGFLVVKLYGEGTVKSISITGNNGEKLAGPATVTASHSSAPSLEFGDDATETITIDCGEGVALGPDASHATEFWFCIPPVTFSKGFTITATNTEGWSMEKSTGSSRTITRNIKTSMSALEAVFDPKEGCVYFDDSNFKAYCVENFDKDGDREISDVEAKDVISIEVDPAIVESLKGIEEFTNLEKLFCNVKCATPAIYSSGEHHYFQTNPDGSFTEIFIKLKNVDLSKNLSLKTLKLNDCQLDVIDVSKNTSLTHLQCLRNQIKSLDLGNNTQLKELDISFCPIESLNVSKNIELETLLCLMGQLASLNVTNNTSLTTLSCPFNQITTLDVSKNTVLTTLECSDNQLTNLDVSKNTALTKLWCDGNQLTSLDISNNTALTDLDCSPMSTLETLYISQGQSIPKVTENRSSDRIPDATKIVDLDNDESNPLTFVANGPIDIALEKTGSPYDITLYYSVNGGDWTPYTIGESISISDKGRLSFRAGDVGNSRFSRGFVTNKGNNFYQFVASGTGTCSLRGNINSLLDPTLENKVVPADAFFYLFKDMTALTDASYLCLPFLSLSPECYFAMFMNTSIESTPALPATSLATSCYEWMFSGCQNLTSAKDLPSTALQPRCYAMMFSYCTKLKESPNFHTGSVAAEECCQEMFDSCTSLEKTVARLDAMTLAPECYYYMFYNCSNLKAAPELPATTLADRCYANMFQGCTRLDSIQEMLPAMTMRTECYNSMFSGCSSLPNCPKLPATTMAERCYQGMFRYCANIKSMPELPSKDLAPYCYSSMFFECSSLSNVTSILPATELKEYCYDEMFYNCTSMTKAPILPAQTLVSKCYNWMFYGCENLTWVKALFGDSSFKGEYCDYWLYGIYTSGTFIKSSRLTIPIQDNFSKCRIPRQWTIITDMTDDESVDLGLPSGIKWATCNVGASSPEEYGNYYAWGETETKTNYK